MKQKQTIFSLTQQADIQLILKRLWHHLGALREPIGNENERKFSLSGKEILQQKASYVGCLGIAKAFLYLASQKKSIQAIALITTSLKSYKQYLKHTAMPFEGHVVIAILGNNEQYYIIDPQNRQLSFYPRLKCIPGEIIYHPLFDPFKKNPYFIAALMSADKLEEINTCDKIINLSLNGYTPEKLLTQSLPFTTNNTRQKNI